MLFKNANIFVGGQFQHGSFRVENGRFAEILTTVPAEDGIALENQYVIPCLVDVHNHGNSGADFSDGYYDGLILSLIHIEICIRDRYRVIKERGQTN